VEDDVTAVLEYANGASGVFVTTTGEAPGTNRLEIVGTRGKLVMEANQAQLMEASDPGEPDRTSISLVPVEFSTE
jgi:predicted dehydrogenase